MQSSLSTSFIYKILLTNGGDAMAIHISLALAAFLNSYNASHDSCAFLPYTNYDNRTTRDTNWMIDFTNGSSSSFFLCAYEELAKKSPFHSVDWLEYYVR